MKLKALVRSICTAAMILSAAPLSADLKLPSGMTAPAAPPTSSNPPIRMAIPLDDGPLTAGCEPAAILSATQVLPAELRVSPHHRVREQVMTDGYMAHYIVDSDFGTFECVGRDQLESCVKEIRAIQKLSEVSRSDLFAEGLKRSLEQPVDAVKNIVSDPAGTVKKVPQTVGHFFKKVGRSVSNAAKSVQRQAEQGEGGLTSGQAQQANQKLGDAGKSLIGFENAKLDCAKQLGVDPYTDNPRLREEIDKVAWVFFSGGLPLRVGAALASGGASVALTSTKFVGLPNEVYALTPAELNLRNEQAMTALQVPEPVRMAFQNNTSLSLTLQRSIIRSLEGLPGARGKAAVIELAASCETRDQARFLEQSLRILARRQASGASKIQEIRIVGRLLGALDESGSFLIPTPVDHITWTNQVADFAHRDDLANVKPVLLLTGSMSELAEKELKAQGWTWVKP